VSEYFPLLAAVAPLFIIILVGWFIRRIGWLTAEADASLLRVIVNLLTPCLILDTILGNRALEKIGNILLAPVAGFVTVAVGYVVCYFAAPLFGAGEPRQRRTFAFTTGIYNYGYIALPIAQTRFGSETSGVLFIHNLGVEIALWTVGIMVITGARQGVGWRRIVNGPAIAILIGGTLHFTGAYAFIPAVVRTAMHSLGLTAIPLGIILTGATFADHARDLSTTSRALPTFGACLLRLGLLPVFMLALAIWLPCPIELRRVLIIQAAMPCGMIPVILAKHYGGDPAAAMRIILFTSAFGLLTIPFWLQLGLRFIGGH
jgi:predicted permease